jgi:methylmalonyl-CoA/ethylmalonyl-CoA epimerase
MKQLLAGLQINQIALVVEDIDASIRQYQQKLGYGPWIGYIYDLNTLQYLVYRGKPSQAKWKFVMTDVGILNFELIQPMSKGDDIFSEFIANHGYGLHHIGYKVDNAQKIIGQAKEYGIGVLQEGRGFGLDGDGHFAYLDTFGILGFIIELRELPKRRAVPHFQYE